LFNASTSLIAHQLRKFGRVYKAIHKTTMETVAIKVLPITKKTLKTVQHEIELLKGCDCPHVVKFYGTYQTRRNVYVRSPSYPPLCVIPPSLSLVDLEFEFVVGVWVLG